MRSRRHQPFIEKLPEELMSIIFSELTVVELARAQRTCKRWYNIAQKNSILWTDATPFFNHIQKWKDFSKKTNLLKVSGLQKLKELSNNKLDGIVLQHNFLHEQEGYDPFRLAIFKAIREHQPTRLNIMMCYLQTHNQGKHDDPCSELLAKNESLKHLRLNLYSDFSSWQLKLASSLESLDLVCPPLSRCSNKEELMKSLMNVKKMKLETNLQRPGNLEFLNKIGQHLENLELIERTNSFAIGGHIDEKKTLIRFPELKELTLDSSPHNSNKFYQLDCPLLQSLSVRQDLLYPTIEGYRQGLSLHELLLSTDTITRVSIFLSDYGERFSSKIMLEHFFGKFQHIKEMHVETPDQSALQYLVNTLPRTVSKLEITLHGYNEFDRTFLNRLKNILENGGVKRKVKNDDNLACTIFVNEGWKKKQYIVTIFGRTNLRALAFGRGK